MAKFPQCAMSTCSLFHDQMYSSWKLDYVRQVIVLRLEILAWHSTLCTVWKIKNFTATVILRETVLCIFWINISSLKSSNSVQLILCEITQSDKFLTFPQCGVLSSYYSEAM